MSVKNREYIYPVIITPEKAEPHAFTVEIPDIDGMTEGNSVSEALDMAIDFVGAYSLDNELPPSNTNLPDRKDNQIISLIQVHPDEYKRKHDNKVIKKTLSIPNYLNELGKEQHINFSEVLTESLKKRLNV
ncbi:type II toxin-antitoxin system HicB family antitoxin [Pediococcus ethanolidurans]|uniref:type II toxin-antitoxin system HicB family antitoxin n=1 Tax=Pediococcus ethanolidurans TaxID=319653 RepID=UPI002955A80E|nr:type II toxin-antitoxin system HicB family antitoxin [Pediococcus ethanolidurans]MDV7718693.1 type II toxin-antitoxin system HicB family antitoxin [Pediococcus ethanolidurans]